MQCVSAFLGARNERVAFEATRVIAMLALPPQAHRLAADVTTVGGGEATALTRNSALRRKLLTVAQARGVVSSSLDVVDFLDASIPAGHEAPATFQFYRAPAEEEKSDDDESAQMVTIPIPSPALAAEDSAYAAADAFEALVQRYNVPRRLHFQLFTKVRAVFATRSKVAREAIVVERLLANVALFHAYSEAWDVTSYVTQNPELTRAIAELVRVELYEKVPARVRVAALQVLTALVYDRGDRSGGVGVLGRQSNVLTALGVVKGTPHGVFPALVRFCMSELGSIAPTASHALSTTDAAATSASSGAPSQQMSSEADSDMDMSLAVAFVHATTDLQSSHEGEAAGGVAARKINTSATDAKLSWIEAVLGLLTAVVGIQLGASVLTENGVVPALLHVITVPSTSPYHIVVTTQCIQALETTVSNHSAAAALYRDLNGVGMLIDRLLLECSSVPNGQTASTPLPEAKVALLVALVVTLSVSFHSQGVMSAGATSRVIREGSVLTKVLVKVFSHVDVFGTEVFAQAAILISDIINNDPSSVNHVHSGGIADAFLDALTRWDVNDLFPAKALLPPSAELVMAIPSVLNVLCLTSAHAEKVVKRDPLLHLLDMFALPAFAEEDASDNFQAEAASVVGGGVFELMRHQPSFQHGAIQACIHAIKKVVRFGDEHAKFGAGVSGVEEQKGKYLVFLRMAGRVADLVEPILTKSEYAVSFADQGGVTSLFKMYRLVLPTTTSFLSSALSSSNDSSAFEKRRMNHHAAAHSITLALRSYASQQPTGMLTALVKELSSQLDDLQAARAVIGARWQFSEVEEGAEGILCSMPDVELAELFGEQVGVNDNVGKIGSVGEYLRVLSTVEWLSGLLVWTLQTAQGLQSRRWFTEFSSKSTQQVLTRLFGVDRSVQYERASLAELHKKQTQPAQKNSELKETSESSQRSRTEMNGLWKVGSLLLLRFTIVMRSLLTAFGKAFLTTPLQHRRGDDSAAHLAPHATALSALVGQILEGHFFYIVAEPRAKQISDFVQQYYLTFLLETIVGVVFEGVKKQANTLLLVQLLKPLQRDTEGTSSQVDAQPSDDIEMTHDGASSHQRAPDNREGFLGDATCLLQVIMNVVEWFFMHCLERQARSPAALSRMDATSFRIAAVALKRFSDLENISLSPLTTALTANEYASEPVDLGGPFVPRVLTVQLHVMCVKVLLSIWRHSEFAALPVDEYISEILPIAVTVLKSRIDQAEPSGDSAGGSEADFDFLSGVRRHGLGFGRGRGAGSFEDESMSLRSALFGGPVRRPGSRHSFVPDAGIVENLTAMGFPRPRVERALRRIQINDVELAMEWILSHPDDEGLNDEEKAQEESEQDESTSSVTDPSESSRGEGDSDEKKREKGLFEAYTAFRDEFEEGCFRVLQTQAKLPSVTGRALSRDGTAASVYPHEDLVKSVAEYFTSLCDQSPDERELVLSRVNSVILKFFGPDGKAAKDFDDKFYTMTSHLLALILQLHPGSREVLRRQKPCCVENLLENLLRSTTQALETNRCDVAISSAPVLLIMDALATGESQASGANSSAAEKTRSEASEGSRAKDSSESSLLSENKTLPALFHHHLVDVCLQLLAILGKDEPTTSSSEQDQGVCATVTHAVMQLLARVTLDYEIASDFLARGGIDLVLNIRKECIFTGYQELVCTLLSQVMESPEVLQQMMEEKIVRALSKLSARLGSPSQMRITPRALLMELAPVAARNEEVFAKALESSVQVKKSESGRTYVVPKKDTPTDMPATSTVPAAASSESTPSHPDEDAKEKKSAAPKVPKSHKQNIQLVSSKIIDKIRAVWATEKHAINEIEQQEREKSSRNEVQTRPVVCVGMYLEFLVHLVKSFPVCASVLTKARDHPHHHHSDPRDGFLRLALKEFLPSKDLCRFVALRRSFKERGLYGTNAGLGADLPLAEVPAFVNVRTKERVQSAHRLLTGVVEQSSDGSKFIVSELIHLLRVWLQDHSTGGADVDYCVRDDDALSCVHAWAGLIMSISWPNGSTKGFAWDKVGSGGSQKGKHAFVSLLAETLQKIDLAHPLAHTTCSMLLRPLATLTRSFVTDRVRRSQKKRNTSAAAATDSAQATSAGTHAQDSSSQTPIEASISRGAADQGDNEAAAHPVQPSHVEPPAAAPFAGTTAGNPISVDEEQDVTMRTPTSGVDDQEMRDAEDESDDADSDRSSDSGRSIDEGEDEGDDDGEEEDEEEDDDDEEEDDDDDDDDDDEEEEDDEEHNDDLLRLRVLRGSAGHNSSRRSSSRLWGSFEPELSMIDALDEVDEEDYSYVNILDDEAVFSEEQQRRAQRAARSRENATSSPGADSTVNSLLDAFMGNTSESGEGRSNAVERAGSAESEEYPFDLPSSDLFRESVLSSQSQDRQGLGTFRNAMLQFLDDLPEVGEDDFLFETFDMGSNALRARNRDRPGSRPDFPGAATTHPLLRPGRNSESAPDSNGLRVPARLSLPRHSSLLRELQELSDQVQTQLPVSFGGGARARLGLQRGGSGGRHRPPSRNSRLSAVSNLLSEFSLDIPPSSHLSHGQPRSHRMGHRDSGRLDRDLFGGRGLRGDTGGANNATLWGPGAPGRDFDIRSVASRLEHRINQMYVEDEPRRSVAGGGAEQSRRDDENASENITPPPAPVQASDRSETSASHASVAGSESEVDELRTHEDDDESREQAAGNDVASETASVIALASTFGESTIRSPEEPDVDLTNSETEAASPLTARDDDLETRASGITLSDERSATLPPPAPVTGAAAGSGSMMSFTLDLSGLQAPASSSSSETDAARGRASREEESKSEDAPTQTTPREAEAIVEEESTELRCPEGIDPEVFASLPPDMQAEIVAQSAPPAPSASGSATQGGSESFSQLDLDMANSSFDRETLEALPPDIRAEVLANERREREALAAAAAAPADISRAQEMDNASFVASLAPELREEILITCDDAFLQTLSSQVRAEAMVLRERAAFRTTYRERQPDTQRAGTARGGGDGIGDLFQRPTLRRMLTSHGADGLVSGTSRRSGRRNVYMDSSGNIRRSSRREGHGGESSAHAGMLRVDHDEEELETERICDDRSVKALLRLLFMAQSMIQNRVLQRVLTNVCVYPLTRESVRVNTLRVITRALARPLLPATDDATDGFPPERLIGCNDISSRGVSKNGPGRFDLPADVLTRMLHVLVSLAKYNPRFSVELLRAHGMRRVADDPKSESGVIEAAEDESGASVLVELLSVPFVCRNGTNLETLLELLELVLLPLDRLSSTKANEEEKKSDNAEDANAKKDESEWVVVPSVKFDVEHTSTVVSVLCMDICTPQMQERTVNILKLLNRVPENRDRVIEAIVHHASVLARTSKSALFGSAAYESSAVLRSAQDELRLLRLLHTLSDICDSTTAFTEYCRTIGLDPLWDELSRSLEDARSKGGLEDKEDGAATVGGVTATAEDDNIDGMVIEGKSAGASCAMAALLARFLPMVEAFFVVNARDAASMKLQVPDSTEREEAVVANLRATGFSAAEGGSGAASASTKSDAPTSEAAGEGMRLANFVEANRVLLNILVREKPSLLDSSLAALIKMSRCRAYLDFDNKRTYFQSAMKKLRQTALRSHGGSSSSVRIPVRREHIFEDSYYALRMRSGQELRRKLHISFTGEEGIDAGGVTREWYMILAREIFNPNYVLFTSAADSPTFQPNPLSYVNKDHLSYFEFVGKVIGKAVADGQLLDAHFTRSFYKHILQLPISYHDMEAIDPEYYRNLHSILDNAIEDLGLELTFSAEQSNFGKVEIVDLIPNGRNVSVTDENKMEYVKLVTHHRMATGIRQQIDAFLKGFHQLVPADMISIFNENELELLISGMPEIDIDDLKANTDYANFKPTDSVIRWFWNVLYSFTHEERALFLQFVTGTSKVPLEGFKALEGMRGTQKFNIHKAYGNTNALPSAHTWYVRLMHR